MKQYRAVCVICVDSHFCMYHFDATIPVADLVQSILHLALRFDRAYLEKYN